MEIPFTKDQYKTLLRAVYMADVMKNKYAETSGDVDRDMQKQAQYVYSVAPQMGCEEYVTQDEDGVLCATTLVEQGMGVLPDVEKYENSALWYGLSMAMMARDVHELYTDTQWDEMTEEEKDALQEKLLNQWDTEFVAHGVERLRVVDVRWGKKK